jgi:hypothetical protein
MQFIPEWSLRRVDIDVFINIKLELISMGNFDDRPIPKGVTWWP